ncbi:MAG: DNA polymerase III subunit delta [Pseudomonadota bacterium]|nr:DNA polymerase III subunit delta [Pseudomonadota bacterium]QKK06116.1 MAG: DNA polymerase III subunit delta [Pseudomonadota bacterium]
MKIQTRDIDRFVQKPDPGCRAFLVYGPDEGLVRERAAILGKHVVEDLSDPFNVIDLPGTVVEEDPARLADELAAMSMMGGRRLIRIRDGAEKAAAMIEDALKTVHAAGNGGDNVLVIEAGDLKPAAKLRSLFEKMKDGAAIPCYVDDAGNLSRILAQDFSAQGLQIDRDALMSLSAKLVGDRALARSMVEKIITYIGPDGGTVTLDDVLACTEDSSLLYIDDMTRAAFAGDAVTAGQMLERLFQEGTHAVGILRGLQNHCKRLLFVKALVAAGENQTGAMKKLRPPVFFKAEKAFTAHLNIWAPADLKMLLEQLTDTEAACKTTGAMDTTITDRLVFRIALLAKKSGSRRAA